MLMRKSYIWNAFEFAPNRIIAFSDENGNELHIIQDWKVVATIKDPSPGNTNKDDIIAFPNFDLEKFPFLLATGK